MKDLSGKYTVKEFLVLVKLKGEMKVNYYYYYDHPDTYETRTISFDSSGNVFIWSIDGMDNNHENRRASVTYDEFCTSWSRTHVL